ncbi:MAG: nuclear transport factor 2 family protein [Methanoregulaceae archaeon]|nr:nuclear transport factor 2 family protein [Methanoregulaceae archaeon]
MKNSTALLMLLVSAIIPSLCAVNSAQTPTQKDPAQEQQLLTLSKDKWQWMADKKVDALDALFHEKAVFVHMGATMTKKQELDTIRSGGIHYKEAKIEKASVRFIESTAIVLNTIRLTAVLGGNEVINPFEVTEVYVQEKGTWKLVALSFTRLLR